jgi:hypothetical protein
MNRVLCAFTLIAGSLMSTGALAQSGQTPPGSLDMTGTQQTTSGEYAVLPVQRGELKDVTHDSRVGEEVKGKSGQPIGKLEKLIMDTKTNKIEYGVVSMEDGVLMPFPWSSFKISRQGEVKLNVTPEQLAPIRDIEESKDLSPDIKKIVKDMQSNMGNPIQPGLGVQKQGPASGGGQGEDQAATGGPSGPRADPPGKAPGFEGAGQKRR